jgi:hypothetical protein
MGASALSRSSKNRPLASLSLSVCKNCGFVESASADDEKHFPVQIEEQPPVHKIGIDIPTNDFLSAWL